MHGDTLTVIKPKWLADEIKEIAQEITKKILTSHFGVAIYYVCHKKEYDELKTKDLTGLCLKTQDLLGLFFI